MLLGVPVEFSVVSLESFTMNRSLTAGFVPRGDASRLQVGEVDDHLVPVGQTRACTDANTRSDIDIEVSDTTASSVSCNGQTRARGPCVDIVDLKRIECIYDLIRADEPCVEGIRQRKRVDVD